MYWIDTWRFPGSNEVEIKYSGNYGAKGERRSPKAKATREQIAKQNQLNKEKRMRRIIKANFVEDDLWITLKYPAGTRRTISEVKKDIKNFLQRLRRAYAKRGEDLKFIYRIEIAGKTGGVHIHLIVNRIAGKPETDILVKKAWAGADKDRHIYYANLYKEGGYEKLAAYIVKQADEEQEEQLSLFPEEEKKDLIKYSCSRNLVRPLPDRRVYSRRTVRKILEEGIKPSSGYYVDKNSIRKGINAYTGYSYIQYTEFLIRDKDGPPRRGDG